MQKQAPYKINDYVLVHTKRFPHRKFTVLGSQWLGPYRVIVAKPHSVVVRASPCFGGEVEVSHNELKRWPFGQEDSDDEDFGFPLEGLEEETKKEEEGEEEDEEASPEGTPEREEEVVQDILKHRYKQGWRFLVKWERWSLEDSTWEPIKSFVQEGVINSKFLDYCIAHDLKQVLEIANKM